MYKVSLLGFSVDNAVCKIFASYNCKNLDLTFIDLVLEVLLGKPLLGPGCRGAALSVLCALTVFGVVQLGLQLCQAVHDRAGVAIQE